MGGENGEIGDVPPVLGSHDQWICWRNECVECGGVHPPDVKECGECGEETAKRPISPHSGYVSDPTDPETWSALERALDHHESSDTHGIGFAFSEDDELAGVDLDDCRDPETGELDEWAESIVTQLHSYAEVSPSGTGVHVYVYGDVPEGGNRRGGVEMYDHNRYFTVTGDRMPQSPGSVNYREDELEAVHSGHIRGASSGGSEIVDFSLDPDEDERDSFENDLGTSLDELRDHDSKLDTLLTEIEPGYDSPSEADMAAVSKLWYWRFGRQDIARIIRTYRRRPKVVDRDDYLELTIAKAATGEQYDPRPSDDYDLDILGDREQYSKTADADPGDRNFVLDKPPRGGGTHLSLDVLSERPLVSLSSRHSIAAHHVEILADVMPDGSCAVHRVGSHRACDNPDQEQCPKHTESQEERDQLVHEAMDILHRKRVVKADDCPAGFCKQEFLNVCESRAHAIATVPELFPRLDRDFEENNLLIDEEQALGSFRPGSPTLVEVTRMYEPDGTKRIQAMSSELQKQSDAFDDIREAIEAEQEERERAAEEEGRGWRRTSWEIDIINAIDYLDDVAGALAVSDVVDRLESDTGSASLKGVVDELITRLNDIERPEPHTAPDDFRGHLSDYTAQFFHDDSVDPGSYIEAALFPYEDKPFDLKQAGNGGYRIRMIGGRVIFSREILREFEQIGVIAGPEGELLFDDLDLDATVLEIDDFKYADDFAVIPVARETNDGPEKPAQQRQRAARVSEKLNERSHPHMAVAGTKKQAENHHNDLDAGLSNVISNPESPAKDIYTAWTAGETAIIYANSAVSRGVDAPPFDISVVISSEFAVPYWKARESFYNGRDKDEETRAAAIKGEIKARELTNAVLRQAPTPSVDDYYGTKFIVTAEWDAHQLKYLRDSLIPAFSSAESVANFVQQLTIPGAIRETIDDVYDRVDGDERAFIEIATQEEFCETKYDRPSFDHDELAAWVENRDLTTGGVCDRTLAALARLRSATTAELTEQLPGWSHKKAKAAMTVLERKGIVESETQVPSGGGPATDRWKLD